MIVATGLRSESCASGTPALWLVVVARDQRPLHEALVRRFAGDPGTRVVLDRRQGERRQRELLPDLERRRAERRRPAGYHHDLRFQWVAVCREQWRRTRDGDLGTSDNRREGGQAGMSITDVGGETKQQVERWIEESQYLLGRVIPSVFDENQRLRDKAVSAEQDCDRMREEIGALRREINDLHAELNQLRGQHDYLRGEQAAIAEALTRAVHHMTQMTQPINEMVAKLHAGQTAMEGSLQ
ncbi:MAG TPA: hypothetical protein VLF19_08595 [Methylomirabilota bacterium]|nr:hypothetical protein [Methylomirabilota bacterium]